jgi:hypothetical protein
MSGGHSHGGFSIGGSTANDGIQLVALVLLALALVARRPLTRLAPRKRALGGRPSRPDASPVGATKTIG